MRESKASTPLPPPIHSGVANRIKNKAFDLDDHRARTSKVFADFDEYQKILSDLKRRVNILEDLIKEVQDG